MLNNKTSKERREKEFFFLKKKNIFRQVFFLKFFSCRDFRPDEEVEELVRALITLLSLSHLKIL